VVVAVAVLLLQLVGEAAVVVGVAVPLLQPAHSVAQRLLLLRFLPFQQRPRLPMPPMRMLRMRQRPAVEAAVVVVVVVAAEEAQAQLLPQRQRPVQQYR
jgi:hypothetical protein